MKDFLEFALRTAILVEKQSLDFYRYAAELVDSEPTQKLLRQLAVEEDQHLQLFHQYYQEHGYGSLGGAISEPPDFSTPAYQAFLRAVHNDTHEREALEIALTEEKNCIGIYTDLSRGFRDGPIRQVFEQALFETRTHCKMIEIEYMRVSLRTPAVEDRSGRERQPLLGALPRARALPPGGEPHKALPPPQVIDAEFEDSTGRR